MGRSRSCSDGDVILILLTFSPHCISLYVTRSDLGHALVGYLIPLSSLSHPFLCVIVRLSRPLCVAPIPCAALVLVSFGVGCRTRDDLTLSDLGTKAVWIAELVETRLVKTTREDCSDVFDIETHSACFVGVGCIFCERVP
jgi:hypothetical protein